MKITEYRSFGLRALRANVFRGRYFWINSGGNKFKTYCDMEHEGGGWQRVFYHRPGTATKCPTGWKEAWVNNGATLYCQRGPPSEGYVPYQRWNEDGDVHFSEVRGWVTLRVQEGATPDGFADNLEATLDTNYMDGLAVEIAHSFLPPRHIFSYVIGRPDYWYRCPSKGASYVSRHPLALPPFQEYSYACDELDTSGAVDANGYYSQQLFYPNQHACTMCPEGMPWFQVGLGETINKTLQFRFVDGRSNDYGISIQWIEIYIR